MGTESMSDDELAAWMQAEHQATKEAVAEMPLGEGSAKTLEDIVREMMRPLLRG